MTAFETRYRTDPDPWETLTSAYEREKRLRTLAACGPGPFAAICDLGAGLGLLAEWLAPRCGRLLALDAAPTAVAAARERLAPLGNAEARVATLPDDLPPDADAFDLVVASEILYYLDDAAFARTLAWLGGTRGRVVAVHWTGTAGDLRRSALDVSGALAATPGLRVVSAEDTGAGYRLDVLERAAT
jgi:trans-aconitate methyltransferase